MVVERCVALRNRLQLVVEVNDDLAQRQVEMQFYAVTTHKFLLDEFSALVETKLHDGTDEGCRRNDACTDIGFFNVVYHRLVGQSRRIVHLFLLTLLRIHHI